MANRRVVAPAGLPISLSAAKIHLNEFAVDQEQNINDVIMAAMEDCENQTLRSVMLQTREETRDSFPNNSYPDNDFIELEYPPIQSIEYVKYLDTAGDEQTLAPASYYLDNASDSTNGWLSPARGYGWPATYDQINSVRIRYVAGYASAAAIPFVMRQWIKIRIGDLYANRESASLTGAPVPFDYVDKMLRPYRAY